MNSASGVINLFQWIYRGFVYIHSMDITCEIQEKADVTYEEPDLSEILQKIHDSTMECCTALDRDLENCVDALMAKELDYMENCTKKALCRIAEYYQIPTKKNSKSEIAAAIVQYEFDVANSVIVDSRRRAWRAIEILRNDPRMQKYVMLDVI